jgi:formate hydrogenlyase subunit 3/multisubunit Na+/H+ antiporter MnhD subunit
VVYPFLLELISSVSFCANNSTHNENEIDKIATIWKLLLAITSIIIFCYNKEKTHKTCVIEISIIIYNSTHNENEIDKIAAIWKLLLAIASIIIFCYNKEKTHKTCVIEISIIIYKSNSHYFSQHYKFINYKNHWKSHSHCSFSQQ